MRTLKSYILTILLSKPKTLYFDKNQKYISEERLNLILSPSFYWVKKERLALKNVSEVKRIAPALFESSLPTNTKYSYYVTKKNDDYFIFAYSVEKIKEQIVASGLMLNQIANIYFAQNEFAPTDIIDTANGYLVGFDSDILYKAPQGFAKTNNTLAYTLSKTTLSKHKASLYEFDFEFDPKQYKLLIASLILLTIGAMLQIYYYVDGAAKYEERKATYLTANKLPQTQMAIGSLIKKYTQTENKQQRIRDVMYQFYTLPFTANEKTMALSVDDRIFLISLKSSDLLQSESVIKNNFKNVTTTQADGILTAKITL